MKNEKEINQSDVNTTDSENEQGQSVENKPLTPLDLVREQQAMEQKNREVTEQRKEPTPEVPGGSKPSTIRQHPQRQLG